MISSLLPLKLFLSETASIEGTFLYAIKESLLKADIYKFNKYYIIV